MPFLLFSSGPARAKPPEVGPVECNPDFPTRCAAAVDAGAPAPFKGQILTPDLAVFLGQTAEHCDERTALEVARTSSIAREDRKADRKNAAADARVAAAEAFAKGYEAGREVAAPSFFERPWFVSVASAALVIGLFALAKKTDLIE